jgi:hypothetical protein
MFATPVTTGRQFTHASPKLLFTNAGLAPDQYQRGYERATRRQGIPDGGVRWG